MVPCRVSNHFVYLETAALLARASNQVIYIHSSYQYYNKLLVSDFVPPLVCAGTRRHERLCTAFIGLPRTRLKNMIWQGDSVTVVAISRQPARFMVLGKIARTSHSASQRLSLLFIYQHTPQLAAILERALNSQSRNSRFRKLSQSRLFERSELMDGI